MKKRIQFLIKKRGFMPFGSLYGAIHDGNKRCPGKFIVHAKIVFAFVGDDGKGLCASQRDNDPVFTNIL
jgi:hypothetical protein